MTNDLAALLADAQMFLSQGFVVFLRVGGVMMLMPAFGEQNIPARVRFGLAVTFTLVTLSGLDPAVIATAARNPVSPTLLGEVLTGLAIGVMLRLFVIALQIAGAIIAQSISLAQMFGGTAGEPQPVVGMLLTLAGLTIAVHLGLHIKIAALLIGSYDVIPPRTFPKSDIILAWGVGGIATAFTLGFSIAMPFVLVGLLYNAAIGAINRAMPQMMVSFIGAPALTFGGLVLLAIAVPTGLMLWNGAFDGFLRNPFVITR